MTSPQFEIRPSLIKGDPADAYLHWTKEVMRLESLNPIVTMDFYASDSGVLCGVEEVKALLKIQFCRESMRIGQWKSCAIRGLTQRKTKSEASDL